MLFLLRKKKGINEGVQWIESYFLFILFRTTFFCWQFVSEQISQDSFQSWIRDWRFRTTRSELDSKCERSQCFRWSTRVCWSHSAASTTRMMKRGWCNHNWWLHLLISRTHEWLGFQAHFSLLAHSCQIHSDILRRHLDADALIGSCAAEIVSMR